MKMSKLEKKLWDQLKKQKLHIGAVPELRFHPSRMWRFDIAYPEPKLAVEVQGGIWMKGKHARPQGILQDYEKFSEAAILGWRLILVTGLEIANGAAVDRVKRALDQDFGWCQKCATS